MGEDQHAEHETGEGAQQKGASPHPAGSAKARIASRIASAISIAPIQAVKVTTPATGKKTESQAGDGVQDARSTSGRSCRRSRR